MIDWSQFHFLRPGWFWALFPLALLLAALLWRLRQGDGWRAVCDAHLLKFLLVGRAERRRALPLVLLGAAWLISVIALAGPTWSKLPQPVFRTTDARVIVLDMSRSMDAGDVTPSRLTRARFKVTDILERSQEGHTGLVAFAGDAFVVSPLTEDENTIASLLPALSTNVMPVQGSRLDRGIRQAVDLLTQAGFAQGDILVLADGGADAAARDAAADARDAGYRVSVMVMGTREGAPIPLPDGDFLKDPGGNIVIPRVDPSALKAVAAAGGGRFVTMTPDARDLNTLLHAEPGAPLGLDATAADETSDAWAEQGPWLVLVLLPLVAGTFRRGWVFALLLGVGLHAPGVMREADAASWDDLWARSDQQAAAALEEGRFEAAAQVAEGAGWRGAAQYRAGDFQSAAQNFAALGSADAHYNRGNALAHAGNLEAAIAAYDEALARDPEHEDAAFNRKLLEQMRQQQQEQQGQDGESRDQQQGEQQGQEQTTEGQQEQQGEQGQASDSESGEERQQEQDAQFADAEPQYRDAPPEPTEFADSDLTPEERQAMEQWLRAIPDDPGGLLRRKFLREYQRRARRGEDVYSGW